MRKICILENTITKKKSIKCIGQKREKGRLSGNR